MTKRYETTVEHKYKLGQIVFIDGGIWFLRDMHPVKIVDYIFRHGKYPQYRVQFKDDFLVWRNETEVYSTAEEGWEAVKND